MSERSSRPSSVMPNHRSVAPVRSVSSCHGTMLEWCSISVMTTSSPGPTRRSPSAHANVLASRLSASVMFLVKITSSRDGRADERRRPCRGRPRTPRSTPRPAVHGAGDVGVVALEVVDHRVDDDLRLLRGVGAVEVDQRLPARERAREDREVLAQDLQIGEQAGERHQTAARLDVLVVALGLELVGELGAALVGDPAGDEHVDVVRLDVAQDPRVVGDQQHGLVVVLGEPVDAVGDDLERVDVEAGVGLVEHRDLGVEQLELGDLVALLLATGEALVDVALRERRVEVERSPWWR